MTVGNSQHLLQVRPSMNLEQNRVRWWESYPLKPSVFPGALYRQLT